MSLAERLCKCMQDLDPYGYADSGYSLEEAKKDLEKNPTLVVGWLLDLIDEFKTYHVIQ